MTIRKEYKLTFCHDPSDSEQAKQFLEFTRIFILKLFKKPASNCTDFFDLYDQNNSG